MDSVIFMKMTSKRKNWKRNKKQGVVLLIAVTVASLVLAIGLGILNITNKEIVLSAYGRESGKAFYASNTGVECALLWDIGYGKNGLTKSPFATSSESGASGALDCAGQVFTPVVSSVSDSATTTFKFSTWSTDYDVLDVDNPCVEVTIAKYEETPSGFPNPVTRTRISAIGYNTCNEDLKRRVSRGVKVQY